MLASLVRPDRISSPITTSAAVMVSPLGPVARMVMPALLPPRPQLSRRPLSGRGGCEGGQDKDKPLPLHIGRFHLKCAEIALCFRPMSNLEFARAQARDTRIKLHGPEAFAGMAKAGRLVAEVLDLLVEEVKPGVTTEALDAFVFDFAMAHGAIP